MSDLIKYRPDSDLEFLGEMASEDLSDLVYCLTHTPNGNGRLVEQLTDRPEYKEHYPDHHQYWKEIAAELQTYGANSVITYVFRRGQGVSYKEVLTDACDRLKVNYNPKPDVLKIENNLLMKVLEDALEDMSPEQLKELADAAGIKNLNKLTPEAVAGVFQHVFRMGGFKAYQLTVTVVNAILKVLIGRGLSIGGNALLVRTLAIITGPIGVAATGVWTVMDAAGPAYRVTIPVVIIVAALRQKHLYADVAENVELT